MRSRFADYAHANASSDNFLSCEALKLERSHLALIVYLSIRYTACSNDFTEELQYEATS